MLFYTFILALDVSFPGLLQPRARFATWKAGAGAGDALELVEAEDEALLLRIEGQQVRGDSARGVFRVCTGAAMKAHIHRRHSKSLSA